MEEALTRVISQIKLLKAIPPNGLAVFCGSDVLELIEPPKPIHAWLYRCSNEFYLAPLELMLANTEVVGILAIDATEAGIGIIDGGNVQILDVITSGVGGKSGKGGQSQRRYERNREAELNAYFHRVADYANDLLLKVNLKSLVVGGPGFTKEDFLKTEYLDYRLRAKITKTVNNEYSGYEGVLQIAKSL